MKNIVFPKIASCILLLITLLITSPTRVSAGTVTFNSDNGAFAVVVNLTAPSLNKTPYGGNSSFGYTINFNYEISFTGVVPPSFFFYSIAGNYVNNDGSQGFPLPTAGGSGIARSYGQTNYNFNNFANATPASLGTVEATITLAGPGLTQTSRVVSLAAPPAVIAPPAPLTAKVKAFTATPSNEGVDIAWETTQEVQVQSFTIDRSSNGTQWTAIETVMAKGAHTSGGSYAITDKENLEGNRYYRLSETDINGTTTYYNTVVVRNVQLNTTPRLFPNPNRGNTIYFTGLEGQDQWQLSITGAGAQNEGLFSVVDGRVTLPELSAGLYFLSLRNAVTGTVNTFRYSKL